MKTNIIAMVKSIDTSGDFNVLYERNCNIMGNLH